MIMKACVQLDPVYDLKDPPHAGLEPGTAKCTELRGFSQTENFYFKDCLPNLFHGFGNKYFNKISLNNLLYFHNYLHKFWENAWVFDKYAMKRILQIKMQIIGFLMASNNIDFNHMCHVIK